VTKGAFYYWFRDKAHIACEVRHVMFESLTNDTLATIDIDDGVLPALRDGFARFVDALHDLGDARRFLAETWRLPADPHGPFDHREGVELLAGLLRTGQANGELGAFDAGAMAMALVAACSKLSLETLGSVPRDAAVDVIDRMLTSMAPRGAEVH
jgi:AcrR family transcriptional regulator